MPTTHWNLTYANGEKFVLTFINGRDLKEAIERAANAGRTEVFSFIPAGREEGEISITIGAGIPVSLEPVTSFS